MEPKFIKSNEEQDSVKSLDSHDRTKKLLDPSSQSTILEDSKDEPLFQCKGDDLRLAKMITWMIATALISALWLVAIFLPFLFSFSLSTLVVVSALIMICAVAMQLKKEKSWMKVFPGRIEWYSFSLEKQILVQNSASFPYTIEVGSVFNRPTIKSPDGRPIGKLPTIYVSDFLNLIGAAQRLKIPVEINTFQPYSYSVDGKILAPTKSFDFMRIVAAMLPLVGVFIMLRLPEGTWMKHLVSGVIVLFFCLISFALQINFFLKRKNRSGLLYGSDTITRIHKDEVVWTLHARDFRCISFKSNAFVVRSEAVTLYGRRHDLGTFGLHALKFALANRIPIVTDGEPAPESEAKQ